MKICVVLCGNIYDHEGVKRMRGDQFNAPDEFADMVLKGDAKAERAPRLVVVDIPSAEPKKRGRPKKEAENETE